MMKWEDITSYSRNEKDRTPRTWATVGGHVRVVVTRHIHHAPDIWVTHCEPWFDGRELVNKDIAKAKDEAISLVRGILLDTLADCDELAKVR